jgi:3-oxoacyl-[acyl-carrier protein] reductase
MAGRRVLITGATKGIGEALVRYALAAGDDVIGCGRSAPAVSHERYTHRLVDVGDGAAVERLFCDLRAQVRTIDVLINNAGVAAMNAIALTPAETARRIVETNFLGTFHFTRAVLRLMRGSSHGRIVNLTTVAVPLRLGGEAVYAASKSAVETFTRVAARELAPFGITCNAVGPSPVRTHLTAGVAAAKMQALIDSQPVARWAEVDDVINVVDFFLRPQSHMVTGQVIYLGGVS